MINQAVILVGGKGLRLGKITKKTPKPLLKINNKPFLDYLINYFIRAPAFDPRTACRLPTL